MVKMRRSFKEGFILFLKVLIVGAAAQFVASPLLTFILSFFPSTANEYMEITDGLLSVDVINMMLVCILAPVLEEIFFRGIICGILKRFIPFFIANLIQALCFAIYHGNLVQGIYAFLLGLFIGLLLYLTGSIVYTIAFHIGINTSAFIVSYIFPMQHITAAETFGAIISSALILIILKGLLEEHKERKTAES